MLAKTKVTLYVYQTKTGSMFELIGKRY